MAGAGARVLVVSGDAGELAALGRALEAVGARAELEEQPEAAQRRLAQRLPDLLVVDGSLPSLAQWRLYSGLREHAEGTETPVILARYPNPPAAREGNDYYLEPSADAAAV